MQSPALNFSPRGLYIGGRWVSPAEGQSFASINPSNMEKLADVPAAGEADVDAAVQAAKAAFKEWSRVPIKERARCLELLADRIEENADELALFDAVDSGNAMVGMRGDMTWTADWLRYCAGLVTEIKGETFSQGGRHLNLTRRQPFGVVAKINPFNHPFRFCAEKAAAPLAAGNTVVIKGSEQAPLSSLRLGELCEGIFPAGVVNILAGDGKVGSALVRHPDVRRIGFVGSVPTGRAIAKEAAADLKRVSSGARRQESDRHISRRRSKEGRARRHQGHEHEPAGPVVQFDLAGFRPRIVARQRRRGTCIAGAGSADRHALAEGERRRADRVAAPI